jgi:hypothetical protein
MKSLLKFIGQSNITDEFDDEQLKKIAQDVIRRYTEDHMSMDEWRECIKKGMDLIKPDWTSKSEPWEGAANYRTTIIAESANTFGNRAAVELLRIPKLVSTSIIGNDTLKNYIDRKASENSKLKAEIDQIKEQIEQLPELAAPFKALTDKFTENQKAITEKKLFMRKRNERAARVGEAMNYTVDVKMKNWREQKERMFYLLPPLGCIFTKTYYDPIEGCPVTEHIGHNDFAVNQATKDLESCRSFTHIIPFSKAEAEYRIDADIWRDVPLYADNADADQGSNEAEGAKKTEDNSHKFLEQYCWLDADDDGIEEPYVVTVHVSSESVVRITPRYSYEGIYASLDGFKPDTILNLQDKRTARIKELGGSEFPDPYDLSDYKLIRVSPMGIINKYGLCPALDGTFLDWGYFHIIGSNVLGVNKTTNDLLNAGTLANLQGGIVAKDFRIKSGAFTLKPGEYKQTEVSSQNLAASILPLPYKEPSPTLYQLNEKMEGAARAFGQAIDLEGQLQANTAPTTALAMIQESLVKQTAHNSMLARAMGREFEYLYSIMRDYLDPDEYKQITADDEADKDADFDEKGLTNTCSANPELASRMQRMMTAEAEMAQIPIVMQVGGNPIPIVKSYFRQIGSENTDDVFPNEAEMSPEEKQQLESMRQVQEQANQMAQAQLQYTQLQTELLKRDQDRKDQEFTVQAQKAMGEMAKMIEEMRKLRAETLLTQEKAETEAVNNGIAIYTAASEQLDKAEQALGAPSAADNQ